jgi:hypothetical protein
MRTYDNMTLETIEPELGPGGKWHVILPQDELTFSVNKQ